MADACGFVPHAVRWTQENRFCRVVQPLNNLHNLPDRWQTERATMQD